MKDVSEWSVPKWPFLLGNALLLIVAGVVIQKTPSPIGHLPLLLATGSVALGALIGILPFVLEYRASAKLVELNGLTTVAEQLANLQHYAEQVAAATDQWARIQESTQAGAAQTTAGAKEIADRMTNEVRSFNEFQAKLNDHEKQMLRLEVEKLRRIEGDWLQVLARILDNIYVLYTVAVRSGQPELIAQIGQFQNACRDATRRVGLATFTGEANEAFDAERHRAHGVENPPDGALIAETVALGIQFQGRLIRPALVRLQAEETPEPAAEPAAEPTPEPEPEAAPATTEDPKAEAVTAEKSAPAPATTPAAEPVAEAAPEATEHPVEQPAPATAPEATEQPVEQPAEKTVAEPALVAEEKPKTPAAPEPAKAAVPTVVKDLFDPA